MDRIKQCIHTCIANISTSENSSVSISAEEVVLCITILKFHKNDGGTGLNTNAILNMPILTKSDILSCGIFAVCYCVSQWCS